MNYPSPPPSQSHAEIFLTPYTSIQMGAVTPMHNDEPNVEFPAGWNEERGFVSPYHRNPFLSTPVPDGVQHSLNVNNGDILRWDAFPHGVAAAEDFSSSWTQGGVDGDPLMNDMWGHNNNTFFPDVDTQGEFTQGEFTQSHVNVGTHMSPSRPERLSTVFTQGDAVAYGPSDAVVTSNDNDGIEHLVEDGVDDQGSLKFIQCPQPARPRRAAVSRGQKPTGVIKLKKNSRPRPMYRPIEMKVRSAVRKDPLIQCTTQFVHYEPQTSSTTTDSSDEESDEESVFDPYDQVTSHEDKLEAGKQRLENDRIRFFNNGYVERIPGTVDGHITATDLNRFDEGLGPERKFRHNEDKFPSEQQSGSTKWRWPELRIKNYMENKWRVDDYAFEGPPHAGRNHWAPATTDLSVLGDIDISAWEIVAFLPATISQYNVSHRLAANGWMPAKIADAINYVHQLPLESHIKGDTVKHKVLASDKRRYGQSWVKCCKANGFAQDRPRVTDGTARYLSAAGGAFECYDRWRPRANPYLLNLAGNATQVKFPEREHRGVLTAAVEFAIKHDLKDCRLSDVPALVAEYNLGQMSHWRKAWMPTPTADMNALDEFKVMMEPIRKELGRSRRKENKISRTTRKRKRSGDDEDEDEDQGRRKKVSRV
ncbi:hypothetical protein BU24DRAFT_410081 [Aaosphaeria arxii CBS 175.79]|uniref:Uncharacterized protein n=1 Tax=Aaosphaeria arxii CBS 175.79 TaxID=1450172 RepID=A0A6A5XNA1_9PLEO|nr:uncharacterized protein BU24DRAFT_410081 [Aaosphaeria arxii CBS 175.79]KAF2014327.1 hypothetical protein BU24DRAFT_410081 [Aaosphaeria arxii CBS 175.79]